MWNKKREDEPLRPSYNPPASPAPPVSHNPLEVRKETSPVSSMPPARFEADSRSGGAATIGKAYGGLSQRDAIVRAVREKADQVRAS